MLSLGAMLSRSSHRDAWLLPAVLRGSGTCLAETTLPLRPLLDGAGARTTVGAFIVDAALGALLPATDPWADGAPCREGGAADLCVRAETWLALSASRGALLLGAALYLLPACDGACGAGARLRMETWLAASLGALLGAARLCWLPAWLRASAVDRRSGPCAADTTVRGRALAELLPAADGAPPPCPELARYCGSSVALSTSTQSPLSEAGPFTVDMGWRSRLPGSAWLERDVSLSFIEP